MQDADALFSAGDIDGARAVLIDQVRADPGNWEVRSFLFQIFALRGEWDRAEKQLDTLAKLDPAAQMLAVAYRQCIAAERDREALIAGKAEHSPRFDYPWLAKLGDALALASSDPSAAASLRAEAFDEAPTTPGTADGTPFEWIADADQRFGPTLETMIAGRYALLPFQALESLIIHAPVDLRDTVWGQAEFGLRDGARVAGYVCVRYPGSHEAKDPDVLRGRVTEWREDGDLETGLGHRLMVLSDGSEHPLMSLRKIEFDRT
ncbi:type VI secretion system accessory protein TagJ [Aurantiacibacter zhengii]|uniref:Virulence protein SciE type n=1 Tax=Aurantiacibacter zhengii TaxID=2307003 RepID=A0A418NMZ7_9SPHN|nr:type VI secretion system accessory protein TagJ [Aurantiacibacter zhengii]RIV82859.1 virulence protein SciE type [Aurantiacibacter zhengii]